jgi:hypothetical protein
VKRCTCLVAGRRLSQSFPRQIHRKRLRIASIQFVDTKARLIRAGYFHDLPACLGGVAPLAVGPPIEIVSCKI